MKSLTHPLGQKLPAQKLAKSVFPLVLALVLAFCCARTMAQSTEDRPSLGGDGNGVSSARVLGTLPALAENGRAISEMANAGSTAKNESDASRKAAPQLRLEQIELQNGAQLLTVFGRLDGVRNNGDAAADVPLISVVRDTLGDNDPENDRLRYVWMLTYTQPSLLKRIAAAVPFLYQQVGNQKQVSRQPAPLIDLANVRRETWNQFYWFGVQNLFLDTYGLPIKASTRNYRRNLADYRSAHVFQALSILATYENLRQRTRDEGELLASSQPVPNAARTKTTDPVNDASLPLLSEPPAGFTSAEMLELRARLIFSSKALGGLAGPSMFRSTVEKRDTKTIDLRDHNWEMLRQRAEAEGLYFEPLTMPDGSATHALLWIAKNDLIQSNRHFNDRFLNIADPWSDKRLRVWKGFTKTWFFDSENRVVPKDNPEARPVEMIPLALYGLDHPKIPAVLIDFRDGLNPKKREMSRRVFHDVAKNILSLSSFGDLPYFLGKQTYDFFTGRRGMDINQPSRLQSYAELKLLLLFNGTIDPTLRNLIERRLETVSLNPLSNDTGHELQVARQQYDALLKYARATDGLPTRIERDRRTEMTSLVHGRKARTFFTVANVLTFGRYVHREKSTPGLAARMELQRRIQWHSEFLQEVAKSGPQIDVVWDLNLVRRSLDFLAEHAEGANGAAARAASSIFDRTNDGSTRQLCLDSLYRINDKAAKKELLRLYRAQQPGSEWKPAIAERLRQAVIEDPRMKPDHVRAVLSELGQP